MSNVREMRDMFYDCSSLQKIGIPSIANGGRKLVENAEDAYLTTVLPRIVSEYGSVGPYTWDDLNTEMTTNPDAFQEGTIWVKAEVVRIKALISPPLILPSRSMTQPKHHILAKIIRYRKVE